MSPYQQIQGPAKVCAATGEPIAPGDRYYSVLVEGADGFERRDYAASAWPGPPPGAVAHWLGRVPAQEPKRRLTINDEVLADCLARLEGATEPAKVNFRYVVALLLMRRKRLRFEDLAREPGGDVMVLRDAKGGTTYRVTDPRLGEAELAAVQDEVFRVLGWD
jgi:hypothetical protein